MPAQHPIPLINLAIDAVLPSEGEPFALAEADAQRLEGGLRELFGTETLLPAVVELCLFATYVGVTLKSPAAQHRLVQVAVTAADELIRMGGIAAELGRDVRGGRTSDFSRYTGQDTPSTKDAPRDPGVGEVKA